MVTPKGKFEGQQAKILAEYYIILKYLVKNKYACLASILLSFRRLTMAAICLRSDVNMTCKL